MVKTLVVAIIGLGLTAGLLGWSAEALASNFCRDLAGQQVCIETIKRSAKYLWEYRVAVSVDGDRHHLRRYDCRPPTGGGQAMAPPQDTSSEGAVSEAAMQQFICGLVPHR
ncbi:MAG: hypothetical protein WBG32_15735 [Nodosilinea sp.]